MSELIRDVPGYEGLYKVSFFGDIYSMGGKRNHSDIILLKKAVDKDGYFRVTLQKNKVREYFRVARVVAVSWIPNPDSLPQVNHIDEDKKNDCVSNLEWVTRYQNYLHSAPNGEIAVVQCDLAGGVIAIYKSLMEASRQTGINQGNITNCLKGRCKSVGGYLWKKAL